MTATIDIEITQGETWQFQFDYKVKDLTSGAVTPRDFTGKTFSMMVRADFDSPVLATLTSQNQKITWDAATGRFTLKLTAADTLKLTLEDAGVYDLFAKGSDGSVQLVKGAVRFNRAVTR